MVKLMHQSNKEIIPFPKQSNQPLNNLNVSQQEHQENKRKWEEAQIELSENNIALEALVKNFGKIKLKTQQEMAMRLNSKILPLLEEIKSEKNLERTEILAELAIEQLKMVIPSPDNPYNILAMLTPMEMRIASMIKDDYKSSDIARLQYISMDTVKTHRCNIRKKLGLTNKQINLTTFLKSIFT
jgi:DNA-binding CsgD family transcriptional regulator